MSREYQNGDGFGYVLSFRRQGSSGWQTARVPGADAQHFVYSNDSVRPYTPFEVKIRGYNRRGDGPESLTALVYSAEEGGPSRPPGLSQPCPAQRRVRGVCGGGGCCSHPSSIPPEGEEGTWPRSQPWLPCLPPPPRGGGAGEGWGGKEAPWEEKQASGMLWEPPCDLHPGPWALENPKQGQSRLAACL